MRQVHARFTGQWGTFAHFGDSITVTRAFWSPLKGERKNASPEMERAFRRVNAELRPECWSDWKGPEFGSDGTRTVSWALERVDGWLKRLNPEVALIMFGSNDVHSMELPQYRDALQALARRCLDNRTAVILSTPPPRAGFEEKSAAFAAAVREIARDLRVPTTDYHAEILKRRPRDWNGALPEFAAFEGYEVPTLICRDGVHPSFPKRFQNDYSPEGLRSSGYTLRNHLTLLSYAEVLEAIRPS